MKYKFMSDFNFEYKIIKSNKSTFKPTYLTVVCNARLN